MLFHDCEMINYNNDSASNFLLKKGTANVIQIPPFPSGTKIANQATGFQVGSGICSKNTKIER